VAHHLVDGVGNLHSDLLAMAGLCRSTITGRSCMPAGARLHKQGAAGTAVYLH
jgi:hypothetical protein